MMFVQSLRGLSHTKLEDTREEHLELAVAALDRLASKTIDWVAERRRALTTVAPGAIVAGSPSGGCLTWNVSNVGAVADPLADALRRLPRGGRAARRRRCSSRISRSSSRPAAAPTGSAAQRALGAIAPPSSGTRSCSRRRLRARAARPCVVGIGSGAGFVAGLDLVRAGGGGPALQGLYGGATMAGGGLALMVVPPLTDATSWRAAYWSAAALALVAAVPTLAASRATPRRARRRLGAARPRAAPPRRPPGRDVRARRRRWELGGAAARAPGSSSTAAGVAGGLILFVGIATRPAGGLLAGRVDGRMPRRALRSSASRPGALLLALDGPARTLGARCSRFRLSWPDSRSP